MNAEVAGIVLLLAVAAILGVTAVLRLRAKTKPSARMLHARERSAGTIRKREPELEARIESVLRGPRQKYGAIFTEYSVWRAGRETRLDLKATAQWARLNEFTRCLVVRYLWRVLESLAGGAVVVVDRPPQEWNVELDSRFHDQGLDWRTFGDGPQFVEEP